MTPIVLLALIILSGVIYSEVLAQTGKNRKAQNIQHIVLIVGGITVFSWVITLLNNIRKIFFI
jgi:hypothetical protein